jgi:hypothetical protein
MHIVAECFSGLSNGGWRWSRAGGILLLRDTIVLSFCRQNTCERETIVRVLSGKAMPSQSSPADWDGMRLILVKITG